MCVERRGACIHLAAAVVQMNPLAWIDVPRGDSDSHAELAYCLPLADSPQRHLMSHAYRFRQGDRKILRNSDNADWPRVAVFEQGGYVIGFVNLNCLLHSRRCAVGFRQWHDTDHCTAPPLYVYNTLFY